MTEQEYRALHEAFLRRLNALDRDDIHDVPESPEEAQWLEKRMKEVVEGKYNDTSESLPF